MCWSAYVDAAGWANQIDSALLLLNIGVSGSSHLWTLWTPIWTPMDPNGPAEHNLFVVGTAPHIYNKIQDIGSVATLAGVQRVQHLQQLCPCVD